MAKLIRTINEDLEATMFTYVKNNIAGRYVNEEDLVGELIETFGLAITPTTIRAAYKIVNAAIMQWHKENNYLI